MLNQTNKSQTSMAIVLTLGALAMTLGSPAFAGEGRAATRGARIPIVRHVRTDPTLPISAKQEIVDRWPSWTLGLPGLDGALRVVLSLVYTLDERTRF